MTELISNPFLGSPPPSAGFPPIPVMAGGSAVAPALQDEQRNARWAEWLAKGVRHDVAMRHRLQLFFYVGCLGLAAGLWWIY
jgi:hypothetical protein